MPDSLFVRLLKALSNDPLLEYDVWKRMHVVNFYHPWKFLSAGQAQVLISEGGTLVANIMTVETGLRGRVFDGVRMEIATLMSDSEDDLKGRIEAILCARQWKVIPVERQVPTEPL